MFFWWLAGGRAVRLRISSFVAGPAEVTKLILDPVFLAEIAAYRPRSHGQCLEALIRAALKQTIMSHAGKAGEKGAQGCFNVDPLMHGRIHSPAQQVSIALSGSCCVPRRWRKTMRWLGE